MKSARTLVAILVTIATSSLLSFVAFGLFSLASTGPGPNGFQSGLEQSFGWAPFGAVLTAPLFIALTVAGAGIFKAVMQEPKFRQTRHPALIASFVGALMGMGWATLFGYIACFDPPIGMHPSCAVALLASFSLFGLAGAASGALYALIAGTSSENAPRNAT
jgi:hypothetical protein